MRAITSPILNLILALLLAASGVGAQETPSEYQLKSAFLFNFARFVEWPPTAFAETNSPLVIGVLGENPFGDDLAHTVQGKIVGGRTLQVQLFQSATEARKCQILFISNSESKHLNEVFAELRGSNVLTVGECEQFTEQGGIVGFLLVNNKIRFQINAQTAQAAGLKISSKLLSLAVRSSR